MNVLKKSCVAVVGVIIASVLLSGAVICLVGCSKKGGATWNSPYSVDYKVVSLNDSNAGMEVTVKGPAAKLAMILTDPDGKPDIGIIEKDQMIGNQQTLKVSMDNPREGMWILTVKTVDPEKVVWQKNIPFLLGKLAVADVKFDFSPNFGPFEGYWVNAFSIVLNKDGNLPVIFSDFSVELDGEKGGGDIVSGRAMADQQHTVGMAVSFQPTPEMVALDRARGGLPHVGAFFRPGERHLVKGKLVFGDNRTLNFEKEFVVPGNSAQGVRTPMADRRSESQRGGRNPRSAR